MHMEMDHLAPNAISEKDEKLEESHFNSSRFNGDSDHSIDRNPSQHLSKPNPSGANVGVLMRQNSLRLRPSNMTDDENECTEVEMSVREY
jgi:hypothetical protein